LAEAVERILEHATVESAALSAVNHRGAWVAAEVVAEDFRELNVCLGLNSPRPDVHVSELEMPLSIRVKSCPEGSVVYHQQHAIQVHEGRQELRQPIPVTRALFNPGTGPYRLELFLGNRLLTRLGFTHKTRTQIKNEKAEAILRALCLSGLELFVVRDGTRVKTDHAFETDTALVPVFTVKASGFDDDVPVFKWRMEFEFVNLDTGRKWRNHHWLRTQEGTNEHRDLEFPLGQIKGELTPGRYRLSLRKRKEHLAACEFNILSRVEIVPYTKKLVFDSLRCDEARLLVQAGAGRYQSSSVPDSSDFLFPELSLLTKDFNAHLPRLQTEVELFLFGDNAPPLLLTTLPVVLSSSPVHLRNVAIRIRDSKILRNHGRYEIAACVLGKEVARLAFQLVGEDEILRQFKVTSLRVNARPKTGRQFTNVSHLQPANCRSFSITVDFEVGILAPNACVQITALLSSRQLELGHADFSLLLDKRQQNISSRPIPATCLPAPSASETGELTIRILVGDDCKAIHTIELMANRITDFEGRLTVDPHRLEVDDAEFDAIIRAL
jgi:hypothetical protein